MYLKYRPEIDGLRALAVGVVIAYHAKIQISENSKFLEGGFLGVDIFFVISGYLISSIIFKELFKNGKFSFLKFFERRIRRIVPVLFFVIFACLPIAWLIILPENLISFVKSILSTTGFSSNYFFHFNQQNYTSLDSLYVPLLHTWSLAVEEQFYLLFPFLIFIFYRYLRSYIFYLLLLIFLVSIVYSHQLSSSQISLNFYSLQSRIWEILAGSLLSYLELTKLKKYKQTGTRDIFIFLGIILIFYSIFYFNESTTHPSFNTFPTILGVCLLIWFAHKDNLIIKILSSKILVGIGLISYSLYLWHYPIFAFSRIRFTGFINDFYTKELIILFTLIILSIFTYFFIEKPSRNKKNKFRFVAIPSLSLMVLFIIFSFKVIKNNGYENRFFTAKNYKLSSFSYLNEFNNYTVNYNYDDYSDNKTNVLIVGNSFSLNYLQILNETKLTKNFYFNHAGPKIRNKNNNYQVHYFLDYLVNNVAHTDGKYDNFLDHLNKQYQLSEIIILGTVWSQLDINSIVQINHKLKEDKKKLIVFDHSICSKPKLSYGFNRLDYFVYINKRLPNEKELFELEEELFYDYNQKTCYQQVIKNINNQIHKITSENNINILKMRDVFCNLESKRCPLLTKEGFKIYWDWGHLTLEGSKYFSKKFEKNKDFIFLLNK